METLNESQNEVKVMTPAERKNEAIKKGVTALIKLARMCYSSQMEDVKVENMYPNAVLTGMTLRQKADYIDSLVFKRCRVYNRVRMDSCVHVLMDVPTIGTATGEELADCLQVLMFSHLGNYVDLVVSTPLSSFSEEDKSRCLRYLDFMDAPISIMNRFRRMEVTDPEPEPETNTKHLVITELFVAALYLCVLLLSVAKHDISSWGIAEIIANGLFTVIGLAACMFVVKFGFYTCSGSERSYSFC